MAPGMPREALVGLDAAGRKRARAWWSRLAPAAQDEFRALWDARTEDTSMAGEVRADGSVEWRSLPIEVRGLIIEGRKDGQPRRWSKSQYEYLLNHPESVVILAGRRFHVCRAHPAAREVLKRGRLEPSFRCPLENERCPMRSLLEAAGGRCVGFSS